MDGPVPEACMGVASGQSVNMQSKLSVDCAIAGSWVGHLAIHVVDLCMHGVGAIRPDIEGIAGVICGPGNPVPHQSGPSVVVVGFTKDGIEQDVTAGQVASLNTRVPHV